MKFFIIGNKYSGTDRFALELSDYYKLKIFKIDKTKNINDINKIVRENKEWIIESNINKNVDTLCNLSETVIFLDYSNNGLFKKKKDSDFDDDEVLKLLQKHIRKGIIIRNKSQLKKYLKMVYESDRYNF